VTEERATAAPLFVTVSRTEMVLPPTPSGGRPALWTNKSGRGVAAQPAAAATSNAAWVVAMVAALRTEPPYAPGAGRRHA